MSFPQVLLYVLQTPSRWLSGLKLALYVLAGSKDISLKIDGIELVCGLRAGEGVWCALRGLEYEPELRTFLALLKPGNTVIDLGANIGTYAIRAGKAVGEYGTVFAFEPLARTRQRLQRSIYLNQAKNVIIVPKAAGDHTGHVSLVVSGRGSSASVIHSVSGGEAHEVLSITIDDFIRTNSISKVDWVKMDIEGGEPSALRGMVTTIEKWRPAFLFENESGGAESANLLRQSGYAIGTVNLSGEFVEDTSGGNLFAFPRERMPKIFTHRTGHH